MKTPAKLILMAALSCVLVVPAFADASIPGKAYVAQIEGSVTFIVDGNAIKLAKGMTVAIQGAHIETGAGSSLVLTYSNGTSIYIDQNTIVDINRFVQKPFPSGVDTTVIEPSQSDTLGRVTQGRVFIVTNELATGTSMIYTTPESQVRIRGKQIVIEVAKQTTTVILLAGDATVTPANAAPGNVGRILSNGQMAVVTAAGAASLAPATIQVLPADPNQTNVYSPMLAAAQRAQNVVVFQTVTVNDGPESAQEIVARAVVPAAPANDLTVSPSTLRSSP